MKESLFKLLELQEIDNQIDAIERIRRDYPADIARIGQEIEGARDQVQAQRMKQEALEKAQRHHERELEAATADLKKHQDRLYEVKTNREYDALQVEIEACRNRVNEQENSILAAAGALEELIPQIQRLGEAFAQEEQERLKRKQELVEKLNAIGSEVQRHQESREAVRVQVVPNALMIYDRIRRGGRTLAVVRLSKRACGGCFLEIPPQRASEVRRSDRIIPCESCGRILVWNGTGPEDQKQR